MSEQERLFGKMFGENIARRMAHVVELAKNGWSDEDYSSAEKDLIDRVTRMPHSADILLMAEEIKSLVHTGLVRSGHVYMAFMVHELMGTVSKGATKCLKDNDEQIRELTAQVKRLKEESRIKDELLIELSQEKINLS